MEQNIIELNQVCVRYKKNWKQIDILRDFSLNVKRGEFVGIIGPSGKGKSTLLHVIAGLKKPYSGRVLVDGKDIYGYNHREMDLYHNQKIGYIFQDFRLISEMNTLQNVILPEIIAGTDKKEAEFKAKTLLSMLDLSHRENHYPHELSGGEQQRIAIARAVIRTPELLLADEPTGNLDADTKGEIL